jgi:hypothetical protein
MTIQKIYIECLWGLSSSQRIFEFDELPLCQLLAVIAKLAKSADLRYDE